MYAAEVILYILVFFIGASIFSFLNVVIYRLPRKLSFVTGRSHCPSCDRALKWYDMIPVLNWFYLRGKCRGCGAKISFRYPAVEALGGVLAVLCVRHWKTTPQTILVFVFLALLTVIAFIDLDTMEIPNELVLAVLVLGILGIFLNPEVSLKEQLIGAVCVSLPMLLLTLAIPGAFGGGDIKLMVGAGLFLGFANCLLGIFLAILGGGGYGIYLLAAKKADKKSHFAFGPFLCLGMAAVVFWGSRILDWYLHLYL